MRRSGHTELQACGSDVYTNVDAILPLWQNQLEMKTTTIREFRKEVSETAAREGSRLGYPAWQARWRPLPAEQSRANSR